jgi:hypothetical protein
MGEIKPLGSEKLQGNEKLKRILELTYFHDPKKSISKTKPETIKESATGIFGVVREKDGYYVKKGLNENSLDYIGGLFMKNKNRFSSYGEAMKRMDLLSGQENLQEATKYVLKQNAPKQETPVPAPAMDEVPPTPPPVDATTTPDDGSGAPPTDDTSMGGDETSTDGGNTGKRSDYMTEIQKYAGKLGQELRDAHERLESDDIKYVLNMIISAVDLEKLDDDDIEELGKKFDRDEDEHGGLPSDDNTGDAPGEDDAPAEEPPSDGSELGENMSKLSKFINSKTPSAQDEMDLSKYADIGSVKEEDDDVKELDMDEIKNELNSRIGETLSKYFK